MCTANTKQHCDVLPLFSLFYSGFLFALPNNGQVNCFALHQCQMYLPLVVFILQILSLFTSRHIVSLIPIKFMMLFTWSSTTLTGSFKGNTLARWENSLATNRKQWKLQIPSTKTLQLRHNKEVLQSIAKATSLAYLMYSWSQVSFRNQINKSA